MRGLLGRTSEREVAKSAAIKGRGSKSGADAAKAIGLTSGGLRRVRKSRTERVRKARDRGAVCGPVRAVCRSSLGKLVLRHD